uniref:Uncharacterized protein n=1 Tax=Moniliophthora roreri TaxID=221103 RepID=A0A0W0FDZ7_MONRR
MVLFGALTPQTHSFYKITWDWDK